MLSDYTFSLLYCWQKELKLSLYIEEEFFVIRGEDYYFFPIGEPNRVKEFIEGSMSTKRRMQTVIMYFGIRQSVNCREADFIL